MTFWQNFVGTFHDWANILSSVSGRPYSASAWTLTIFSALQEKVEVRVETRDQDSTAVNKTCLPIVVLRPP